MIEMTLKPMKRPSKPPVLAAPMKCVEIICVRTLTIQLTQKLSEADQLLSFLAAERVLAKEYMQMRQIVD